jgi:putative tRNA adenosine deaminase-associated protein
MRDHADVTAGSGGPVLEQPLDDAVDFALAAYLEDGAWQVDLMPPHVADDLQTLVSAVRQRPGDRGALGLVSVDEDFFVAVRVVGQSVRLLLSDVTAATEWPLARAVLDTLHLPLPEDEEQVQPAGDLSLFDDLGLEPMAVAAICDDIDLYPEEMLAQVADRLGFGAEFERAVDSALA